MSDNQTGGSISGNGGDDPMVQAVTFLKEGRLDESKVICEQVLDGNGDNRLRAPTHFLNKAKELPCTCASLHKSGTAR